MNQNTIDLTKLTVVEIKAIAFDELVKLETAQNNIKICNDELRKRNEAPAVSDAGGTPSPAEFLPDQTDTPEDPKV